MILAAIILFCLAATLGLSLVVLGVRYHRGSATLAAGHAVVALLALGLLGKQVLTGPTHMLYNDAALLFVLTLVGGLVLLAIRISKRERRAPPPMFVVSIHAIIALIALLLLVVGYTHR
jgi:peptidoglycan/LPS O-acetylase OafA/YrhL